MLCEASGASAAGSAAGILRRIRMRYQVISYSICRGILRRIRMRLLHYVTQKKREV